MKSADPYLMFSGNAEEAFSFYKSVFGCEFEALVRFGDFPGEGMQVGRQFDDKIAHVALRLGPNHLLMASDCVGPRGEALRMGTNQYIHLETDTRNEAERVFDALAVGGEIEMPLARTEWAERFGSLGDRFGVRWMISFTGDVKFPA